MGKDVIINHGSDCEECSKTLTETAYLHSYRELVKSDMREIMKDVLSEEMPKYICLRRDINSINRWLMKIEVGGKKIYLTIVTFIIYVIYDLFFKK